MNKWAKAIGIGVLLATFGVASAQALEPRETVLRSSGKSIRATLGSSCWNDPLIGLTTCGDAAYPLPVRCSLPVKRGVKLIITTGAPADTLDALLLRPRPKSSIPARRVLPPWKGQPGAPGSTTWRFRLTKAARKYAVIEVFATYSQGDVDSWTGLATRSCRKAGYPKRD